MIRVVILTGERGVGKSAVCCKIIALARRVGHTCAGILTLSGPGLDREVLDVSTGRKRQLTVEPGSGTSVIQGRFRFSPEVLSWGQSVLCSTTSCSLLVIDELGPLEVEEARGWSSAFEVLGRADYLLGLVVVRPELVDRVRHRLGHGTITVRRVTPQNREGLPRTIARMIPRRSC